MGVLNLSNVLDRSLNVAVMSMVNRVLPCGFDVASDAPDTFDALSDHVKRTGRICVWNGASDRTIYGDSEVNFAARAWHDWAHVTGGHDFTLSGEIAACERQIADMIKVYGDNETTRRWAELLRAEVIGQAQHLYVFGEFPADQVAFVKRWTEDAKYRQTLADLAPICERNGPAYPADIVA